MWNIIGKAIALKSGYQINWLVINNFSCFFIHCGWADSFSHSNKKLKLQFTKNTVYMIFKGDAI